MFSPVFDYAGGAVIAANRMFHGFRNNGIETKMLVGKTSVANPAVKVIPHNFAGEKILSRFTIPFGLNYVHYYSTFRIKKDPFYQEADILNFHTIHSGYFNYLALSSLTRHKPAVITLHDQWTFTGHCGFSYDCLKWKTGCGNCPYPNEYPPMKRDSSKIEWKLKFRTYAKSNLTVVTPSNWLSSLAGQSMLNRFNIHTIANGLDTALFAPIDQITARKQLGIPEGKKVLLFGAMGLDDQRKGGDLLIEALNKLTEKDNILLLVMGQSGKDFAQKINLPVMDMGYIKEDAMKPAIFSAADYFLFPSRGDNLPCIIQESLACGTPVIAFAVGGVPDMVVDGETGFLARTSNANEFARIISSALMLKETEELRRKCRNFAVNNYAMEKQVMAYKNLFNTLLNSKT